MRNPTTVDLETEPQKFLSRSDWTLAASDPARKKFDKLLAEFANKKQHYNSNHGNYQYFSGSYTVGKYR